jgi:2-oxoglutarate dehydrogenase E2 component (dihydrolipoamide succinyltransferase)
MPVDVTIPEVGESITEGILAEWSRADGDVVARDEPLLVLETDKITMNVNATEAGRLKILVEEGETVEVGQVVATIDPDAQAPAAEAGRDADDASGSEAGAEAEPAPEPPTADQKTESAAAAPESGPERPDTGDDAPPRAETSGPAGPAAARLMRQHELESDTVKGTGRAGRVTKGDVLRHLDRDPETAAVEPEIEAPSQPASAPVAPVPITSERQTREPMSMLRRRIAERLVEVQQQAAILTTFNEADMSAVMSLRSKHKQDFADRHGVGLGFMSFFVKAVIDALKTVPTVNAYLDGDSVVTNHYYDIGIAVSTDHGLVVPVVRNADQLSMAGIERAIADLATRAQERRLELSELSGAVFTISNGGVFGSMMSTPILNPPGSAILGMHAITKRPVVVDDEIVIRPMMYLAVSYDHRLIDGRDSVTFLKRIVECIEDPERMLLEV